MTESSLPTPTVGLPLRLKASTVTAAIPTIAPMRVITMIR
jgi:hypothetical protein